MSSKADKDKVKQLQDKCLSVLNALLRDEDNKYCVDCDSKGPRWASWNLGVFLCIRCAGIHRNLGVHISKVKSVNLDSWTPEQVVSLQQMGNSRARAVYEANLPDSFRRPQNDSSLETFIRAKYEHKKYIAREWVPPPPPEVHWEREIDEEIERQRRKKKGSSSSGVEKKPTATMTVTSLPSVEVPQLPKPRHNASPKTAAKAAAAAAATATTAKTDLLGLQNGDDSFSSFLSAPAVNGATTTATTAAAAAAAAEKEADMKREEASFFNQPAPTEKERAKLTKDSILALYATAPPTNTFVAGGGGFSTAPPQFPAFNAFGPPGNFGVMQNGVMPSFAQQQQQQQQHFPVNPVYSHFASHHHFSAPHQFHTPMQPAPPPPPPASGGGVPNFFASSQSSVGLPMQFGNLSLGGAANGTSTTSNVWQ